jgi:hypothetical protein
VPTAVPVTLNIDVSGRHFKPTTTIFILLFGKFIRSRENMADFVEYGRLDVFANDLNNEIIRVGKVAELLEHCLVNKRKLSIGSSDTKARRWS